VRATAERSILVLPAARWRVVVGRCIDWCRAQPRSAAAAALVAVTLLSGLAAGPAAPAASADAPLARTADPAVTPQADQQPALYPLAPLPRPVDGPVPTGKGMWIHKLNRAAGGNIRVLVDQAKAAGLTHVYVRLGSSKSGFYARQDLDRLLPAAHAAGLKVVGWDFPYLNDPLADAARAREMIWYATPWGHRIDAFSADIETTSEGTRLTDTAVRDYGNALRAAVGDKYPLIATVPRPSPKRWFPFGALTAFDAIAPMVYWGNRDPAVDVAGAIANLSFLNKPVIPVGQAYDMAVDGGPRGAPSRQALEKFISSAATHGATGVSFWVWDQATDEHWLAISHASQFAAG
jgi:hypothetical protein